MTPLRLNILRSGYLLIAAGMGSIIWPAILNPNTHWELTHSVVACMLGALSALCVLGLRYPLKMLPLLLFEIAWKTIWLLRIALPLWSASRLDAAAAETAFECAFSILILAVIPWDHVWRQFVIQPGDPWRRAVQAASPAANPLAQAH